MDDNNSKTKIEESSPENSLSDIIKSKAKMKFLSHFFLLNIECILVCVGFTSISLYYVNVKRRHHLHVNGASH